MKKYLNSVKEVVKALKEGKDVFASEPITDRVYKFYFKDGFLIGEEKNCADIHINTHLIFMQSSKYYTEEPEPLKFEVNKLYKTSKNKKAFLYKIVKDAQFMYYFSSEDGCFTTDENGVFYNFGLPTDNKIVGYWEEEK